MTRDADAARVSDYITLDQSNWAFPKGITYWRLDSSWSRQLMIDKYFLFPPSSMTLLKKRRPTQWRRFL